MGNLYIISAPSGAGKSSLITAMIEQNPNYAMKISVSYTTRTIRDGEVNGEHYHFISKDEFLQLVKQGDFLEHAEVFGNYYGTSRSWIDKSLQKGIDIFLDIDWQGARQVRQQMPNAISIFILPPSKEELERRLYAREQDSPEIITKRMARAQSEMSHYNEYDYVIINDDFDNALYNFKTILRAERLREQKVSLKHKNLLDILIYSG